MRGICKMGKIDILYEDNHLIAAAKYPGILAQSDGREKDDLLSAVKRYIKERDGKPGNVYLALLHRLDMPAGGIMLFAKTSKAAGRLNTQIRERKIGKFYLAVAKGILDQKTGELDGYILKDRDRNISVICHQEDPGARHARLKYRVMDEKEGDSLVSIELITGRSHQIRVQFAYSGHPLLGDRKYGSNDFHYTVALWAYKLVFMHPVTNEEIILTLLPESKGIWNRFEYGEY